MKIPVKTVCGLDVHKDSVFCRILQAYGQINQHKFGILPDGPMTLRNLMLSEGGGVYVGELRHLQCANLAVHERNYKTLSYQHLFHKAAS